MILIISLIGVILTALLFGFIGMFALTALFPEEEWVHEDLSDEF
jgi:hypothetical protein